MNWQKSSDYIEAMKVWEDCGPWWGGGSEAAVWQQENWLNTREVGMGD